ncbi:MAG: PSD1 domain-containing protein [Planctomycetes bacterium]|nr:PSD1 domain-containing protein [Planctomycetota bacterium]
MTAAISAAGASLAMVCAIPSVVSSQRWPGNATPAATASRATDSSPCYLPAMLVVRATILASLGGLTATLAAQDQAEFFETKVRPLLHANCVKCHGPTTQKSSLRLDHSSLIRKGGARGPAIDEHDLAHSRILHATAWDDPDLQMPPKARLADDDLATLRAWILGGAFWPDEPIPAATANEPRFDFDERRRHWAWQPLADPTPPTVRNGQWVKDPLDAFILAELEAKDLTPAPAADPATLLRRLWFDLVGLPPPPGAVAAFAADPSDAAYDRIVDDLLASPHFGERHARHWLDLVRFAETMGHEFDYAIPNAWRYRDWVIRSLNADVPFDQFAKEHVAGDLMQNPRRDPVTGANESVPGTGAFWFPEQTHSPVDVDQHTADRIDNQIDVMCKSVLGITVACARCHDHKFDAIRATDYYALYGFLKSSRYVQRPIAPLDSFDPRYEAVRAAQRQLDDSGPADSGLQLREGERLIADARDPFAWWTVNDAFGGAPWHGPWLHVGDRPAEVRTLPGTWWNSAIAGEGRDGVVQTGTFTIEHRWLHLRVAGRNARATVIVEGFNLARDPIYGPCFHGVGNEQPYWLTFDLGMWPGRSAYAQVTDQRAPDLADPSRGGDYPADAWAAVQFAVHSPHREPPRTTDDTSTLASPDETTRQRIVTAIAALPAPSPTVPAMTDGTGQDEQVFARGSHKNRTTPAPRRFLAALAGDQPMPLGAGSGRLQLAEAMLAPDNPLPSRVLVNRVWHHLFGRGFVRSVDNLGKLGDPPTHPRLLDRLARDLIDRGWSYKGLVRRIVRSATWRQASSSRLASANEVDPQNLLLHRQNVRRLQGEAIRDALLVIADRLDPRLYGESIAVPLTGHHEMRGKPGESGPVDGFGRRSIYLAVRRNFLPPMLQAFDLPTPFATVGARSVSNVPAQALTLMNDPFVHGMCRLWAEHLLADSGEEHTDDHRIASMVAAAWARSATPDELQACRELLADRRGEHVGDPADPGPWADLAHVLVLAKEFSFLR